MTPTSDTSHIARPTTGERADLLATLAARRQFLLHTVHGLSDEQAVQRPTASELTLGGIIKHVTAVEANWANFMVDGPVDEEISLEERMVRHAANFRVEPGETLAGLLDAYEQVAGRTDHLVATLPDLDASHPLPKAPWFEPGARWTVRRTALHIATETAHHAGHADIIRETIDGQKTMG
jgi:uncharacterized damage-inducible protein DinB